ncbi:MAG: UDP-glucose/GDP-mannose dehydrogenase family protein [Deltaproteobacteria bacterium]|nr:UDP-glucose/GDP-mannose dehydrogenase family protein [Deltaproteobacteria bacterium]
MNKNIAIIGSGYVGLVTGTCFAEMGHTVHCVDRDVQLVKRLNEGQVPIHEPGLPDLISRNVLKKRLFFTNSYEEALKQADFAFIAVDTPANEDGSANLDRISQVVEQILPHALPSLIVILKSTVPVRTSRAFKDQLRKRGATSIEVVSNPEFLREGAAVEDFLRPARVVIGASNPAAAEKAAELYRPLVQNESDLLLMDNESAELSKYACNGILAAKISYMNAIAALCDEMQIDVRNIQRVMRTDPRIGGYISPGIGFGGSCFPKDVRALTHIAKSMGCPNGFFEDIIMVNEFQHRWLFRAISSYFGDTVRGLKVGVWGLAFKPDTDDIREAPSLDLLKNGIEAGMKFQVYDPAAMSRVKSLLGESPELRYAEDPYAAAEGADCLAICTEWQHYRQPDLARLKKLMRSPVIFDGRNCVDIQEVRGAGFIYRGVGIRFL